MSVLKFMRVCVAVVAVCALAAAAQAETITFDGLGYVAGSIPPSPWLEEYGNTDKWSVEAGLGYGGTQALTVDYGRTVAYDLPVPLTPSMGAQSISILFDPAGSTGYTACYTTYGGFQVGNGSHKDDWGSYLGVLFREEGDENYVILGPGGYTMGTFTPNSAPNWYEITFDINAAWDTMTMSAGPVGAATPASMTYAWDGSDITRIWPVWGDSLLTGQRGIYDDVVITPEPASLTLLGLGGLGLLLCRRRRRKT